MFRKKALIYLMLAALALSSCGRDEIRIGIIGDQFGAYSAADAYGIMAQAAEDLKEYDPDIVLHVGDMLESISNINSFEDYRANFEKALDIMSGFNCPWLLAVGDHDVVPQIYEPMSEDRSREKWFMDLIRMTKLPISDKPYYSYNYLGYHFVVLYSMENLHTDPRWGSIFLNRISEEQLDWLKKDLEANKHSKGVIALVHHPHWYVWQNWKPVHDVLKAYNTCAVIAGHYHYDQDEGQIDGIRYLVMGSSGGVIKESDIHSAAQEIAILRLKGCNISEMKLLEIGSGKELEWTPRVSMDRLQAISCILDNLYRDIEVYGDGRTLYQKDDRGDFNQLYSLGLSSIANPLDLPLEISIKPKEELYSDAYWIMKTDTLRQVSITLEPGERSGWANYSTAGNWGPLPVIWAAELKDTSLSSFKTLGFEISLAFEDTQRRELNKTLHYYIGKK